MEIPNNLVWFYKRFKQRIKLPNYLLMWLIDVTEINSKSNVKLVGEFYKECNLCSYTDLLKLSNCAYY